MTYQIIRPTLPGSPILALLLSLSLAGCGGEAASGSNGKAAATDTAGAVAGHADEGDVVVLDTAAITVAGIRLGSVDTVSTTGLLVTGAITYDADRVSHIGSRTDGRILALRADLGERVRAGQPLAVLESPEVGQTRADEHEAEALLAIAKENFAREERLEKAGISSRKELLDAQAELRRAEAAYRSAHERLRVLGAEHGEGSQFAITAPFAGVIVQRHASRGEMATPSDELFTVADLSRLWIELDVFERDLMRVAIGQAVDVTTAAYPGRAFAGKVVYVGDILDPEKRTVRARVEIRNSDGALKPGMFARAVIDTPAGEGKTTLAVPRGAVQDVEGATVVWVPGDEAGEFRAQPVEVGEGLDGDRVAILSGLEPGSRIVTEGAFTLKAELSKGEFGGHGH